MTDADRKFYLSLCGYIGALIAVLVVYLQGHSVGESLTLAAALGALLKGLENSKDIGDVKTSVNGTHTAMVTEMAGVRTELKAAVVTIAAQDKAKELAEQQLIQGEKDRIRESRPADGNQPPH